MGARATMLVLAALAAAGCSDKLPSRALVDDLRVLAVRADPPEAAPGMTVTFDGLVGDPEVPARPVRRGWAICTPGDGGVATCGDPTRVVVLGTGLRVTWTVPDDFLTELDPEDAETGRDVFVVLGIELEMEEGKPGPGEHDVAFKRIRISTHPAPNTNPLIESLTLDGRSADGHLPVDVDERLELAVRPVAGAAETYIGPDGEEKVEELRYTWLVTGGSIGDPVTWGEGEDGVSVTDWKLPDDRDPPHQTLWVVLRDGRGGTAWASQPVTFR